MKKRRIFSLILAILLVLGTTACSTTAQDKVKSVNVKKRIIRISHAQSETHPEHIGLLAFKQYIENRLGNKYDVEIFPNAILGPAQQTIELTQTGAIDFVVASTANLGSFAKVYEIFSMPYLFDSADAYKATMEDTPYMSKIYQLTDSSGLRVLTWYNAGTRNFYAKKPIKTLADLKGMKIRVQQDPVSVSMVKAFGAAAAPMSFGEVYTAIQQGVIDGAENNELALTNNKHGEVAKYFSYDMHQMMPDMLIGNLNFLKHLSPEEQKIFQEAAAESTKVELAEWDKQVAAAKKTAQQKMHVTFINVNVKQFQKKVLPLQKEMLTENPNIVDFYQHIQKIDQEYSKAG